MPTTEHYVLHFGGPFDWSRIEVHEAVAVATMHHMTSETRAALTVSGRAACALAASHDPYRIPGTRRRVCLRCDERL